MFRHVVMMQIAPDATAAQRDALVGALRGLPARVSTIRGYTVGTDARVNEGNYDLVVVADFDDVAGYLVYRDHPSHQQVIADFVKPIMVGRAAVQHEM